MSVCDVSYINNKPVVKVFVCVCCTLLLLTEERDRFLCVRQHGAGVRWLRLWRSAGRSHLMGKDQEDGVASQSEKSRRYLPLSFIASVLAQMWSHPITFL